MKSPIRSPAIRRLTECAGRLGFRIEFAPYLESAEMPGLLGRYAGLCDHQRKVIRVRTVGASRQQIAAVIEHELEHAQGLERGTDWPEFGLRCGGTVAAMI